MHSCPGGPHGGIAARGVGLHSPCTGGSSGMCLVTAYTCRRYQARGGGSGGSESYDYSSTAFQLLRIESPAQKSSGVYNFLARH